MPNPLDYERRLTRTRSIAIVALVCGLCCGPAAVGLAMLASGDSVPDSKKDFLSSLAIVAPIAGAFVFSGVARITLSVHSTSRERLLANIAIVSTVAWGTIIGVYVFLVDAAGKF